MSQPMRVIVCGSRHFYEVPPIRDALSSLAPNTIVIHGGAQGADTTAGVVAREIGLHVCEMRALWNFHGKKAGPLRNQAMLDLGVNRIYAFRSKGFSPGTDDMVRRAEAENVAVYLYIEGYGWHGEAP